MSAHLVIQLITPQPGQILRHTGSIHVSAYVTLSCGAPTCSGGRYDPRGFRVTAELFREDLLVCASYMSFMETASEFVCDLLTKDRGRHKLVISALDNNSGMAGRNSWDLEIRP